MNNNYFDTADELLRDFKPISLAEMDKVKLMDRMDSKYVLSFNKINQILGSITGEYFVLTINNNRIFNYRTDYFDTPDLHMFSDHHNGKLNRFKVRQREYIESGTRFLEVKFKSNKGRVIKDRIQKTFNDHEDFEVFVHKYTPYDPENLKIIIINRFNRFTLVDKHMQERVTVDFNLFFSDQVREMSLNGLVVIEVKQNKNSRMSAIHKALRENKLRPESFSKYCLGISMLNKHDKSNNFKKTINLIHKLSHVETNMFA